LRYREKRMTYYILGALLAILILMLLILSWLNVTLYRILKKTTKQLDNRNWEKYVWRKWNKRRRQNRSFLEEKLLAKGYKRIAIYGCGDLGRSLYNELKGTAITVAYYIDKNANSMNEEIDVLPNNQNLPDVDAVVVTIVTQYYEIKNELKKYCKSEIIPFEDIV
jgi:FlaA1/EpsC-like NDP-sugar epimerase